ncbi:hypothetical protein [Mucilaginibacter defluvii]
MKKYNLILKIISWLQIVGGITGLLMLAYLLSGTGAINGPILLIFTTGLSLFIFSIVSGAKLLHGAKYGVLFTIINQILQLVHWKMLGYGFAYSSGVQLALGFNEGSLKFNLGLIQSNFSMAIKSNEGFTFQLNIAALIVLVLVIECVRRQKNQQQKEENTTIFDEPATEEKL